MKDPRELPEHLEDVSERPIDADRVISDDELRAGGLAPVRAYVRTKAGKSAERQKRYRDKQESEGFKQTNVQVPEEHQETIRELARKLREGEPLEVAVPKPKPKPEQVEAEKPAPEKPDKEETARPGAGQGTLTEADQKLLAVAKGAGFRSRLVRLLAGI
jgi:hypothetical protein